MTTGMKDDTNVRERRFDIEGVTIAAREWRQAGLPVIALHGWLDNAASFDVLAPLLPNLHILALDLPGHGHSDHKPFHATYNIWDDLLIILAVADAMGWQQFVVMGHSRGAMMSLLLSASMPERIRALIALDGLLPPPANASEAATQLGQFLQDYRQLAHRKMPSFDSFDDVVAARRRAISMGEESAIRIVERATESVDGRYIWHSDPRLKAASAFKLTAEHCDAMVKALKCPALVILAEQGLGNYAAFAERVRTYSELSVCEIAGGHHFHMEGAAQPIAGKIEGFLQQQSITTTI